MNPLLSSQRCMLPLFHIFMFMECLTAWIVSMYVNGFAFACIPCKRNRHWLPQRCLTWLGKTKSTPKISDSFFFSTFIHIGLKCSHITLHIAIDFVHLWLYENLLKSFRLKRLNCAIQFKRIIIERCYQNFSLYYLLLKSLSICSLFNSYDSFWLTHR